MVEAWIMAMCIVQKMCLAYLLWAIVTGQGERPWPRLRWRWER